MDIDVNTRFLKHFAFYGSFRRLTDVDGASDGIEIAKAAGFTRLCWFKNREPQFINI